MKTIIFFIAVATSLFSFDLDLEIAKIQQADAKERYILMNNLKRALFQENSARRQEILHRMHLNVKHRQSSQHSNQHKNLENKWHIKK
jgi:hypothetical protein